MEAGQPGPQSPAQSAPTLPESPQSPPSPEAASIASPLSPALASAPLTSVGKRFGAFVLEGVLAFITLGIGWLIWTLIILGRGQTPAKQLLHMRVINTSDGQVPSYGRMLVRELPAKFVIGLAASVTVIGLVLYFWLCWDDRNQELWDKMVDTVVVDDPQDLLAPA